MVRGEAGGVRVDRGEAGGMRVERGEGGGGSREAGEGGGGGGVWLEGGGWIGGRGSDWRGWGGVRVAWGGGRGVGGGGGGCVVEGLVLPALEDRRWRRKVERLLDACCSWLAGWLEVCDGWAGPTVLVWLLVRVKGWSGLVWAGLDWSGLPVCQARFWCGPRRWA